MTKTTLRDYARTLATRPSALRLSERGIDTSNAFAGETLTNLRIQHIGYDAFFGEDGEPAHWALDGVNMNADPVELSEDIRFFRSHAEAVAGIPDFLSRPVGAVPGPLTSAASSGCHRLIQEGAALITSAQDVRALIIREMEN